MYKGIEWLKKEISKRDKGTIYTCDLMCLINNLDEPEVLSHEWIRNNQERKGVHFFVNVAKLQNLVVPKKELPVIPKYVADWIKEEQGTMSNWKLPSSFISDSKYKKDQRRYKWLQVEGNMDKFMSALINSYEVEEEPLYHALIKGHDVSSSDDVYWNYDKYDNDVFVSRLYPSHDNFLTEMSKEDWNKRGINDSNADFVEVEENE